MKRKEQSFGFAPDLTNAAAPTAREVNELLMSRAGPRFAGLLMAHLEQATERRKERLAEDEEARRHRQSRLAQNEENRRSRIEAVFASKRWSHDTAVSWIGYRNKDDLDRPTRHGVMYDYGGSRLVDKEPEKSIVEAVAKGRLQKFENAYGDVWYESEQVRAVFPEAGESAPLSNAPPCKALIDELAEGLNTTRHAGLVSTSELTEEADKVRASERSEFSRAGGKRSGEARRQRRSWVPHATELAMKVVSRDPNARNTKMVEQILLGWERASAECPQARTLMKFVTELRKSGQLLQRTGSLLQRTG